MLRWFWAAVLLLVASPALAQAPERAPVPEWVVQAALAWPLRGGEVAPDCAGPKSNGIL